jgi:hypothetical protein
MIEGKGQQILDKIQLSPTKTISTNTMHNIFFQVRPFQFHTPLRVQANGLIIAGILESLATTTRTCSSTIASSITLSKTFNNNNNNYNI